MFMNDSNMSDINAALDESIQSNDNSMDVSGIVHELAVEASKHIDNDSLMCAQEVVFNHIIYKLRDYIYR